MCLNSKESKGQILGDEVLKVVGTNDRNFQCSEGPCV